MRGYVAFLLLAMSPAVYPQIAQFPYVEDFDGVTPPNLPAGWTSTQNRTPGTNDFSSTASSSRSSPNAVLSTNARVSQSLTSPLLSFSGRVVDSIVFHERRSNTDTTGVLVDASTDGGVTFPVVIGDTLQLENPGSYVRRAFPIPSVLSGSDSVRIRWRVLGNQRGGPTATLRFDDIVISTRTRFDAAPGPARFYPQFPFPGDSVTVAADVRNFGVQPIQDFPIKFYDDRNQDSLPHATELFDSVRVTFPILPGDSLTVMATLRDLPLGEKYVIVQSELANDENSANDRSIVLVSVSVRPSSIVVNEIMYGPTSPEPEWIEITNTTDDAINLKQWKISDRTTSSRHTIVQTDVWLRPQEFAIITRDSLALLDQHAGITSTVLMVPSLPASYFNNDSDGVVLVDQRTATVDSVYYRASWGGTQGRSLERIGSGGSSDSAANWGSSVSSERSTPGKKNSVTPKDSDVAVGRIAFAPPIPSAGDSVVVEAMIRNEGILRAENIIVEFFEDVNRDSLPQATERFSAGAVAQMLPSDSVVLAALRSGLTAGDYLFIVRTGLAADEDTSNNIKYAVLSVGYPARTIVVNEIMYAPASEPEWVEFYNTSADSVNLKGWKIGNRNRSPLYTISAMDAPLLGDQYAVVTKDTALFFARHLGVSALVIQVPMLPTFLFSNSGDAVIFMDARGAVMDSVFYTPGWGGGNGHSLERLDPRNSLTDSANWGGSQDTAGSTPGRQNSITPVEFDLRAGRMTSWRSYGSIGIGVVVANVGRARASGYSIALYHDIDGDSLAQPSELLERRSGTPGLDPRDSVSVFFFWDGAGAGRNRMIAQIEYSGDLRSANNTCFGVVVVGYQAQTLVVNEIMYDPQTDQAEYTELLHRGEALVDVQDWTISDMPDASGRTNEFVLARESVIVSPGDYVVVSSDSTLFTRYGVGPDSSRSIHWFVMNRTNLSLNNDGDAVVLKDHSGSLIDSVRYDPDWHNSRIFDATGRALERINPELPSTDRRNWSTSAHPGGGTPGERNSIYTSSVPTSAAMTFSPNPFSPDGDAHEDFTMISFEVPTSSALVRMRIYDVMGRLVRTLVNAEPSGARGSVVWDGMNDDRNRVRMGIYIVLLEALDSFGATVYSAKDVVVVAAKL